MVVIKIPSKAANIGLSIAAVLLALLLLEAGSTFWLNRLASPEDYRRYALYTQIDPSLFLWTGHHYLNYYPSPNYQKDRLGHNSLGYRGDEYPVQRPVGV